MIERLTSGSSCSPDEDRAATASLDWHTELASINQSHADSPSEFYTYVKGFSDPSTLPTNEDKKRTRLIEPVARVSDLHPSVCSTVSLLHLTISSFSSSNRVSSVQQPGGRGKGGAARSAPKVPSQFQPLLRALSASLPCLEWPTPAAFVQRVRTFRLDPAVAASNLLLTQALVLKRTRLAFTECHDQSAGQSGGPVRGGMRSDSPAAGAGGANGMVVCRMEVEAALTAVLHPALCLPVGLQSALPLVADERQRRAEALRKRRKEQKQAYIKQKRVNEEAGLPPPPPVDTAAFEAMMMADSIAAPKRIRVLDQARERLVDEVDMALAVLRDATENVRDKQVCLWLEAMRHSQHHY